MMRRGRIFYFRKRLPLAGENRESNSFLCLSLRTDLPADAVKRAAALLAVYEQKEDQIVDAILNDTLTKEDAKALLTEVLRAELARLLLTQCEMTKTSDAELDARVEELEAENKALKRAARQGNWDGVRNLLDAATKLIAIAAPEPLDPDLGRQAISLKRRLTEIEVEVLEGDDLRQCAKPLLNDTGIEDLDAFVQTPVLLSVAIARTFELWPSKAMKGNTQAIANLAMEFFGDVPVSTITRERQKAFFEMDGARAQNQRKKSLQKPVQLQWENLEQGVRDFPSGCEGRQDH
ncbi:hypothetical protein DW2_16475 [Thioclava atlantica]|uniref:Uncharacterized protein n=1 Tax=Thioclava atlantica TaxID=1317124 RepID=A0A085TSZ4_9RHOB|nr:hypothetical protein DW2_16475 [Thioclava atlantica]